MMVLMDRNQPYSEALKVPCFLVLELIQSRLEEGLSTLDGDKAARARKHARTVLEFGSIRNMIDEVSEQMKTVPPEGATL